MTRDLVLIRGSSPASVRNAFVRNAFVRNALVSPGRICASVQVTTGRDARISGGFAANAQSAWRVL